ncbi:MAG TPA: protein kinase, partial [Thermoanaerobaculia bacterium]
MNALLCPSCGQPASEFDARCTGCGARLPSETWVEIPRSQARPSGDGDILAGRTISHFRVLGKLGSGGMGVVYRALDLELDREVALKLLAPRALGKPRDEARFLREARIAAALDHPNIGTIYEIGEHEGRRFLAMTLYDGETLGARLDRAGKLSISETVAITAQLASALAAAHEAGVVHRDLKPSNIQITGAERVKL